jgi:hypothetical protein
VRLRDGSLAWITGRVWVRPFELEGRRADGELELWRASGHWRENKQDHPYDIVEGVRPDGTGFAFSVQHAAAIS